MLSRSSCWLFVDNFTDNFIHVVHLLNKYTLNIISSHETILRYGPLRYLLVLLMYKLPIYFPIRHSLSECSTLTTRTVYWLITHTSASPSPARAQRVFDRPSAAGLNSGNRATTPVADVITRRVFGASMEKQNKTTTQGGEVRHD